jgi:DNA-directed RNA polymerase subunit M/transcription elongation factor TFIIS
MISVRPPVAKTKGVPPIVYPEDEINGGLRTEAKALLEDIVKRSGVYKDERLNDKIARDLECCILVYSKSKPFAYRKKLNQLTYNLAINGPFLLKAYYPWELAFINNAALGQNTEEELALENHKAQIEVFQDGLNDTLKVLKAQTEADRAITGGSQVRCKACKSTNIFDFQKQTRSADEGMTWFFKCRDCGKTGRIS